MMELNSSAEDDNYNDNEDPRDPERLFNNYFESDGFRKPQKRMQIHQEEDETPTAFVYPNQEALANHMVKIIKMILIQSNGDRAKLEDFNSIAFNIFTPNRNVLGKQTIQRICETKGVLPKYFEEKYKASADEREEVMKFAIDSVVKLNSGKAEEAKFKVIEERIAAEPDRLQILIFDEAHHSATFQTKDQRPSPYNKFVNKWNSEDHPNVICLFVSATPFNLMTTKKRFPDRKMYWDPNLSDFLVNANSIRLRKREFPLHEINWSMAYINQFQQGRRMRLMALIIKEEQFRRGHAHQRTSYGWLSYDETEMKIFATEDKSKAKVFQVKGDIFNHMEISTSINGEIYYWTRNPGPGSKKAHIILQPHSAGKCLFEVQMESGEGLINFFGHNNQQRFDLRVELQKDSKTYYLFGHQVRRGQLNPLIPRCFPAPNNETFLMFPPDDHSDYYLSLNHIVNSLRFTDEEEQLVKYDHLLHTIVKSPKLFDATQSDDCDKNIIGGIECGCKKYVPYDDRYSLKCDSCEHVHSSNSNFKIQCALYCLSLIMVKGLEELKKHGPSAFITSIKQSNSRFIEKLRDETLQHKPLLVKTYEGLLDELVYRFSRPSGRMDIDEEQAKQFITVALIRNNDNESPLMLVNDEESMNRVVRKIQILMGGTMRIVQDCLTPIPNCTDEISGHMAIIRAKLIVDGTMFKQSMNIAKWACGLESKLEIIQDFGPATTLSQHISSTIEDAIETENPEVLRIIQFIQRGKCQFTSSCNCTEYLSEPDDSYSIECKNCGHQHTNFESYKDLQKLPCLLILVNKGTMGDTFPESFIALDDRVTEGMQNYKPYLTSFTQEKGRLCRYTSLQKRHPYMYVNHDLYHDLRHYLIKDCSFIKSFVDKKLIDSKIIMRQKKNDVEVMFEPTRHADMAISKKARNNHLLLSAEPQCGKTGVYLRLISILRHLIGDDVFEAAELDEDDEIEEAVVEANIVLDDKFKLCTPYWKDITALPALPKEISSKNKYYRLVGQYVYPVKEKPTVSLSGGSSRTRTRIPTLVKMQPTKLSTHTIHHDIHACQLCQSRIALNSEGYDGTWPLIDQRFQCWVPEFKSKRFPNMDEVFIMTPSFHRSQTARLNWTHIMNDVNYTHIVFVRPDEFDEYVKIWGHLVVIVKLPNSLAGIEEHVDNGDVGFARRAIQLFAQDYDIPRFFMADDNHYSIMFGLQDEKPINFRQLYEVIQNLGNEAKPIPKDYDDFQPHQDLKSKTYGGYTGPLDTFGIIGFRRFRRHRTLKPFDKRQACSFFFLNNEKLLSKGVLFKPWPAWEDLNICNEAEEKNLTVLKFNAFSFRKALTNRRPLVFSWTEDHCQKLKANFFKTRNVQDIKEVEKIMRNHLKRLTIERIIGNPFFNFEIETVSDSGMILIWLEKFEDLFSNQFTIDCKGLTIVLRIEEFTNLCKSDQFSYKEIQIQEMSFKLSSIYSTHYPLAVGDFVVISGRFLDSELVKHLKKHFNKKTQECEKLTQENKKLKEKSKRIPLKESSFLQILSSSSTPSRRKRRADSDDNGNLRKKFSKERFALY